MLTSVNVTASVSSICAGASTTLTASGGSAMCGATGYISEHCVSPSATTTYTLQAQIPVAVRAVGSITMVVNATPSVSVSASSSSICAGASATLTVSGASRYLWSNGATSASISVSPSATTTYSVTGTNASGCSVVISKTITVNVLPV